MAQANKSSPERVFIWDLDDTLMWASSAYSAAFSKFHKYLQDLFGDRLLELRTLGTISEEIDKKLMQKIDPETGKPYGYSMARFPESLVRTYRGLCDQDDYEDYQELVARRVRMIGMEAFDPLVYKQHGLVEGAKEVLDFIRDKGDAQILLTKGERLVQDAKIVTLDLDAWFGEEIYVVDTKTSADFQKIQSRFPQSTIFSIGNSFSSDIQPALEVGALGILIPYYTWIGEDPPPTENMNDVFTIKRVLGLIDLYPNLPLKSSRKKN